MWQAMNGRMAGDAPVYCALSDQRLCSLARHRLVTDQRNARCRRRHGPDKLFRGHRNASSPTRHFQSRNLELRGS
jgi:hypothetical protein